MKGSPNKIKSIATGKSDSELSTFLEVIHRFSVSVSKIDSVDDVLWKITKELVPDLNLLDCVIYKVNYADKSLKQVAAYGVKNKQDFDIDNKLTLNFGEGHAGIVAKTGKSLLIEDCSKSPDYIADVELAGSEIDVPIKINNNVIAVISSEHPDKGFYTEFHLKLFEVIASIAVGTLVKIYEKNELQKIKEKLENIVKKKNTDLDRVIDTVSKQYSELKIQNDKQDSLMQEVHHRVNNNLQVISSILNLYITSAEGKELKSLNQVFNRVQSMALIHQNIYKSFEMNLVDLNAYFRDLLNHLKVLNRKVYFLFEINASFQLINLTTLVPLGLLITELISEWLNDYEKNDIDNVKFILSIDELEENKSYRINICDNINVDLSSDRDYTKETKTTHILISALIEQLEGEMKLNFDNKNCLLLNFKSIN